MKGESKINDTPLNLSNKTMESFALGRINEIIDIYPDCYNISRRIHFEVVRHYKKIINLYKDSTKSFLRKTQKARTWGYKTKSRRYVLDDSVFKRVEGMIKGNIELGISALSYEHIFSKGLSRKISKTSATLIEYCWEQDFERKTIDKTAGIVNGFLLWLDKKLNKNTIMGKIIDKKDIRRFKNKKKFEDVTQTYFKKLIET